MFFLHLKMGNSRTAKINHPDIMTYDHPHRERSGRVILQRRIFEVKTMRADSRMNKYNPRNPNRRVVEKRAEIEAHYTKRAKKLDVTFAYS